MLLSLIGRLTWAISFLKWFTLWFWHLSFVHLEILCSALQSLALSTLKRMRILSPSRLLAAQLPKCPGFCFGSSVGWLPIWWSVWLLTILVLTFSLSCLVIRLISLSTSVISTSSSGYLSEHTYAFPDSILSSGVFCQLMISATTALPLVLSTDAKRGIYIG